MTSAPNPRQNTRRAGTIAHIMDALPGTRQQIIERSGLSRCTVYEGIKELRAQHKVRVCAWSRHPVRGPSIPTLEAGSRPDVVDRIKYLTKQERSARYTASLIGTERHDKLKAKWRTRHWEQKAVKQPQSWLSALGGQP